MAGPRKLRGGLAGYASSCDVNVGPVSASLSQETALMSATLYNDRSPGVSAFQASRRAGNGAGSDAD